MTEEVSASEDSGDGVPLTRAEARRAADAEVAAVDAPSFQSHVRAARSEFEHQIEKARADFEQANERINARTGRNLLVAVLSGLAIGAAVLGSLLFVKSLFLVFVIPVCLLGLFEFSRALQASGRKVDVWPQLAVGTLMMFAGYFAGHWTHWVITFAAVAFVIVWRMLAQMAARDGRRYGDVLSDVLVAGFVPLYVPFLASLTLVLLRQDEGELWLLTMIIIVVARRHRSLCLRTGVRAASDGAEDQSQEDLGGLRRGDGGRGRRRGARGAVPHPHPRLGGGAHGCRGARLGDSG